MKAFDLLSRFVGVGARAIYKLTPFDRSKRTLFNHAVGKGACAVVEKEVGFLPALQYESARLDDTAGTRAASVHVQPDALNVSGAVRRRCANNAVGVHVARERRLRVVDEKREHLRQTLTIERRLHFLRLAFARVRRVRVGVLVLRDTALW